jgi:hypothetical protein
MSPKKPRTVAPPSSELADHEILRLDAVGAFVDLRDAGITHELFWPHSLM